MAYFQSDKTGYGFPIMLMVFFAGVPALQAATPTSPMHPSFFISVKNERWSAKIDQVPLRTVLADLTARFPVTFTLKGIERESISASFNDLSFDQGLEKLLVEYDYAIIHLSPKSLDADSLQPSMEIVVLSRNSHTSSRISHIQPVIQKFKNTHQPTIISLPQEHQGPHLISSVAPSEEKAKAEFIPLLEQVLGPEDPATPQLLQEVLHRLEIE